MTKHLTKYYDAVKAKIIHEGKDFNSMKESKQALDQTIAPEFCWLVYCEMNNWVSVIK